MSLESLPVSQQPCYSLQYLFWDLVHPLPHPHKGQWTVRGKGKVECGVPPSPFRGLHSLSVTRTILTIHGTLC